MALGYYMLKGKSLPPNNSENSHFTNWEQGESSSTFEGDCSIDANTYRESHSALEGDFPFYAKKAMSAPEQILYYRLASSLPDHVILAQVGLSRLLGVKRGYNFAAWNNRINRMSADFVVCAKDASVVAVIELDDASHEREQNHVL